MILIICILLNKKKRVKIYAQVKKIKREHAVLIENRRK